MKSVHKLVSAIILIALAILAAVPGMAQVPRAVFSEMSSATW